jgi:hypothetical protein
MARQQVKYLNSYSDKLENIRAMAAVNPGYLLTAKRKGKDGRPEGIFKIPTDETGALVDYEHRYPQQVAYNLYRDAKRSGLPVRLWFLKARRVGLTSLFAALETINSWAMDNRRVGIIAHNDERARRILSMCKGYYKRLPAFMQLPLSKDATAGLKYAQHDSELVIGTCTKPEKVRGDGLHEAHLSEAAYYGNHFGKVLTEISTTIAPAAGTSIIIESTGRARGSAAHKHWQESVEGKTIYKAHFLPWHEDPNNIMLFDDDKHRKMIIGSLKDVEPRLLEKLIYWQHKLKTEERRELTAEHFYWAYWTYLYRCDQNFDYFCRDFPFDAEEAWTAEGDSFFGQNEIQQAKPDDKYHLFGFNGRFINKTFDRFNDLEELKKVSDFESTPHIKVWASPMQGREYVIGADASWGGANSTFTAGYVIDKETREMMAAYHGRIRPDEHAFIMASLGHIYNDAILAPEINPGGGGMQILTDLQRLGYYNIYTWRKRDRVTGMELVNSVGWVTNNWSRPLALGELYKMFHDCVHKRFADPGMFRDRSLINEMRSFHVNPDTGRPEAFADSFDDRILALAIAHRCAGDETIGGADRYMRYDKDDNTHPLIKMAEEITARDESEDAASVIDMLVSGKFDLENGQVSWHEEDIA